MAPAPGPPLRGGDDSLWTTCGRWKERKAMKDPVQERIEREISEHDIVLFMKGTPVFPQCGFSSLVVQVLSHLGVKFKGVDVLSDPALRQGIKAFSDCRQSRSSMSEANLSAVATS